LGTDKSVDVLEYKPQTEYVEVSNEFATVLVRKVMTRNGARLEITSPKLGYHVYLDPLQLESLTWISKEVYDEFLKTPFGPR
jgi:hypothetical protein